MPSHASVTSDALMSCVSPCKEAKSTAEFLSALKLGYRGLHHHLVKADDSEYAIERLGKLMASPGSAVRDKRLLELCAWPIFDKPALPLDDSHPPEFLWMFCLPFIIQLDQAALSKPLTLASLALDKRAMQGVLSDESLINPQAFPSFLPGLYTAADLQKRDPMQWASAFIKAELGLGPVEAPQSPLRFDPGIESGRILRAYAVGIARLPVGEKTLLTSPANWPAPALERIVLAALAEQGVAVEDAHSLPLCTMAETVLTCNSIGYQALLKTLQLAKSLYSLRSVELQILSDGWAELQGTTQSGETYLLAPPLPFVEPSEGLNDCVSHACLNSELEFKGTFFAAAATSSMLH